MKTKCDFCEKPATVFLTQIIDGQMKKICLCESCAKEKNVTDPTGFSLADMLLGALPNVEAIVKKSRNSSRKCPNCGFSADDLNRTRRFGCSKCFSFFGDEVELILRGMHVGLTHQGKSPQGYEAIHAKEEKLEQLKLALNEAISKELYEDAARIRDEISAIEPSPSSPTTP
jgi:protein arginine kinase activator